MGECVVLEEGKFKLSQAFSDKMARERVEKEERRKQRLINAEKKAEEKARQREEQ